MEEKEELALRRQADEALRHALGDPAKAAIARIAYQMVVDGKSEAEVRASMGKRTRPPKVDLAEARRAEVERYFRSRGFEISVPRPDVSNSKLKRWRREGRELFYRPATAELSYAAWMSAHGQGEHWTVADEAERKKVCWEDAEAGYWFSAEVARECPRLSTSWNGLTEAIRLLSLEEYAVAYWTHRGLTGTRLDAGTWCWLRTRFGLGALSASDFDGGVNVDWNDAVSLSVPDGDEGGRAAEVVATAA